MALIADQDRVIELRGLRSRPAFQLGGKSGNVVISSKVYTVHKGWRVIAVDGRRPDVGELAAAIAAAQHKSRYTVTFRLREDDDDSLRDQAREDAEQSDLEPRRSLRTQRQLVGAHLQKSIGLPPRDEVADPQQKMLEVFSNTAATQRKTGPCDKCDGPHHGDDCPHFKGKQRDQHKDAWVAYGKKSAADNNSKTAHVLRNARVVRQPGDGSCLFHSLAYGLGTDATRLRAEIADHISSNPDSLVADNPIQDWVLWDAGTDVKSYARTMRSGSRWGGAVELAVCAEIKGLPIHVYERGSSGLVRISSFGGDAAHGRVVNVLYGGRVHYDAIEVGKADTN